MASGSLGAEEAAEREKQRRDDNWKVYTRRVHRKTDKNIQNDAVAAVPATATTATGQDDRERADKEVEAVVTSEKNDASESQQTIVNEEADNQETANKEVGIVVANEKNDIPESQQTRANEESDTLQQQRLPQPLPEEEQSLPRVEMVSDDPSSVPCQEAEVPSDREKSRAGTAMGSDDGSVRPLVSRVENRMNICFSAAKSTDEITELRSKLMADLDQVRILTKKLEDKEAQLIAHSGDVGGAVQVAAAADSSGGHAGIFGRRQLLQHDRMIDGGSGRVNLDVGPIRLNNSRSFRQLSVSVGDDDHHGVSEVLLEKRTPKANQYYQNSDFILGKDKFPPAGKKQKSSGSKKHGSGESDYVFRMDKQTLKKCSNLLQKLMKHKHGWVFNEPVNVEVLNLHDYFDIIKHPMDLGTIKTRLNRNWYKSPSEFAEDVRLTFHNAMTYNPKGHDVHVMAEELLKIFEEKWMSIEAEHNRKVTYKMVRDVGLPTPVSRKSVLPTYVPAPQPPLLSLPSASERVRHLERSRSMSGPVDPRPKPSYSMGRTPVPKKPKANDPHKRDMTFEEKQRLSTNLQSIPPEKLDAIVQIIRKRNSALSQHDDEIEVDIDRVDAETLWELDRFVTNYKKNLSKKKRKAELALQARAEAGQAVQQTNSAPANVEVPNETRSDERNTAPSGREEKQTEDGSGSDSSSSSSSDSGSSSSDSDSDSSSSSGSDGSH